MPIIGGRPEPGDRGDVDDGAAVLAHPRPVDLAGPLQRREDVDVEDLSHRVEGGVDRRRGHGVRAHVVHQVVDAPIGLHHRVDDLVLVGRVVRPPGHEGGPLRPQLGHGGSEGLLVATGETDPDAALHQGLGDGQSDTSARSGDDGCSRLVRHAYSPGWTAAGPLTGGAQAWHAV